MLQKNSKPQKVISELLDQYKVKYTSEHRIPNCKNKRPLPFDFAIWKEEDIICLLEYQGEQHFFPIWGKTNLSKTQENDSIKKRFCKESEIKLVEINYAQQNQLDQIITCLLKELGVVSF